MRRGQKPWQKLVFCSVGIFYIISDIWRITSNPLVISAVEDCIHSKNLFIWEQDGTTCCSMLDIVQQHLGPTSLLSLSKQWNLYSGPGRHVQIILDEPLHWWAAHIELHLSHGPHRICLDAPFDLVNQLFGPHRSGTTRPRFSWGCSSIFQLLFNFVDCTSGYSQLCCNLSRCQTGNAAIQVQLKFSSFSAEA